MFAAGFEIIEGVFTSEECDEIAAAFDHNLSLNGRAGARNLMSNPLVSTIAAEERLTSIAERIFGIPLQGYAVSKNRKGKVACGVAPGHGTAG